MKYIFAIFFIVGVLLIAGQNDKKNAERYSLAYPKLCEDIEGNMNPCE